MHAHQNIKATGLVKFLPVIFGSIGLIVSAAYEAQRSGVFLHTYYSFDRFIQHHLSSIAGFASLTALFGVVAGLLILRIRGRSGFVSFGTVFSLVVLLWSVLGLSL
jgi:ABC-type branched-subunit amino acid transport system permease subunit